MHVDVSPKCLCAANQILQLGNSLSLSDATVYPSTSILSATPTSQTEEYFIRPILRGARFPPVLPDLIDL